jgi:hypothetical protein
MIPVMSCRQAVRSKYCPVGRNSTCSSALPWSSAAIRCCAAKVSASSQASVSAYTIG